MGILRRPWALWAGASSLGILASDRERSGLQTKLVAYRHAALLTGWSSGVGLMLGVVMIAGSFVGTRIVDRLPERVFVRLVEAVLILTGLWFLIRG